MGMVHKCTECGNEVLGRCYACRPMNDNEKSVERESLNREELEAEIDRLRESVDALRALSCFLAKYQNDLCLLRYNWMTQSGDDFREAVIGQWPIIQGTHNQIALQRVGELEFDSSLIPKAIKKLLEEKQ